MKPSDLKKKYFEFFREKGHKVVHSAPLVPEHDPTVLFTTAGMHPLVPYLMGEPHPLGKRLVNVVSVEDGGRFYMKTNRNMIVEIDENENLDIPDDFIWLTLPQLKKLLKMDKVVNSLARSVMGSW